MHVPNHVCFAQDHSLKDPITGDGYDDLVGGPRTDWTSHIVATLLRL